MPVMKLSILSQKLWLATTTILSFTQHTQSAPIDDLARLLHLVDRASAAQTTPSPLFGLQQITKQTCGNPCGAASQLCCESDETCIPNARGAATCSPSSQNILQKRREIQPRQNAGTWQTYTTTWVETNLVTKTSVYTSLVAAATGVSGCNYAANESPCGSPLGSSCCPSGYYCTNQLTCAVAGNGGFTTTGVVGVVPARPTTISGVVVTSTVRASTTVAYQSPVATGGMAGNGTIEASTSGGLSGGAIAGIVIGVLLGIALLALLAFCCCLQAILGLFGKGKKKKERRHSTVVSEETEYIRRHRHNGAGAAAALGLGAGALAGRQWHGRNSRRSRSSSDRYTRDSRRKPAPKKSKWGNGLAALASGAGAAALLGGLFNKKKKGAKTEKSGTSRSSSDRISYSYYSYTGKLCHNLRL